MMPWNKPLRRGTLLRRYKRFLADVELEDGNMVTVHCANSGSMKTCAEPGRPVVISDSKNPKRKLRHTWELIHMGESWVGVHSAFANHAVAHAIEQGNIPTIQPPDELRREVRYKRSRVDLYFHSSEEQACYIEVKHSTMRVDDCAAFPDAVSERGRKHLEDLTMMVQEGARAVMFFSVGRLDCAAFRPADEIDPAYGRALRQARDAGVEILAYAFDYHPEGITLQKALPIRWDHAAPVEPKPPAPRSVSSSSATA